MDKAAQVSIDAIARVREKLRAERSTQSGWPEPKPLPSGLAPVEPFSADFLPDALAPWVNDIANRLQCPPDYVAVAALTSLGSVIGRRIGIKPQARADWIEIPNVWGCFIGRPGMLKSPAMNEACDQSIILRPKLRRKMRSHSKLMPLD
jgi:putative DNA primase/helicase